MRTAIFCIALAITDGFNKMVSFETNKEVASFMAILFFVFAAMDIVDWLKD